MCRTLEIQKLYRIHRRRVSKNTKISKVESTTLPWGDLRSCPKCSLYHSSVSLLRLIHGKIVIMAGRFRISTVGIYCQPTRPQRLFSGAFAEVLWHFWKELSHRLKWAMASKTQRERDFIMVTHCPTDNCSHQMVFFVQIMYSSIPCPLHLKIPWWPASLWTCRSVNPQYGVICRALYACTNYVM